VLALVAVALAVTVKEGRYYLLPKRFFTVESGTLYRSGYLEPMPLRKVIAEQKLKTIVCLLNNEPDNPDQRKEESVVRETGVRLVRIGMPGTGLADFGALDRAADAIADRANWPLLVHCAGGENRTGAAYAAYRMKHCGWTFEQAIAEGDKFNLPLREKPELVEHLRKYYQQRVATRPASRSSKPTSGDRAAQGG
jgi:protein tyrosine/serine phosphatase